MGPNGWGAAKGTRPRGPNLCCHAAHRCTQPRLLPPSLQRVLRKLCMLCTLRTCWAAGASANSDEGWRRRQADSGGAVGRSVGDATNVCSFSSTVHAAGEGRWVGVGRNLAGQAPCSHAGPTLCWLAEGTAVRSSQRPRGIPAGIAGLSFPPPSFFLLPPDSGGIVRASFRTVQVGVRLGLARVAASDRRHLRLERGGGSVPTVAMQPIATYLHGGGEGMERCLVRLGSELALSATLLIVMPLHNRSP